MTKIQKKFLTLTSMTVISLGVINLAFSDNDDDEDSKHDVPPVKNQVYTKECGACHLAYQPGLLPAKSWAQVIDSTALAKHYGDDASLAEETRKDLAVYLEQNAADHSNSTRAQAFAVAPEVTASDTLPRITATRYFQRKHHEIPARLVTGNPEVKSFSQCNTCHRGAAEGVYNEHQVNIPGHGPWDD